LWLQVELLVCEGGHEEYYPDEALEKIRAARYNVQRMHEIERNPSRYCFFLRSIQEQLGSEGRFIHLGLTSSDVLDTGLAVQLKKQEHSHQVHLRTC
jgi:adenylosuccinate lyase